MPSILKCNDCLKFISFSFLVVVLSFIGTSLLLGKGLPGLSQYKEERKFSSSSCKVDAVILNAGPDKFKLKCDADDVQDDHIFQVCQKLLTSSHFVDGNVIVFEGNPPDLYNFEYSYDEKIFTVEPLHDLLFYARQNTTFECYVPEGASPVFKKTQNLTKTVNYLFWPLLCLVVCWTSVIACCYKCFIRKIKEAGSLRLYQLQLACEEGNVDKLSKYLVSRHLKTPLDDKCNLQHFRQNPTIDINDKNHRKVSSLRCAILGRKYTLLSKSHLECIELLLIHGANVQDATFAPKPNFPDGLTVIVIYLYSKKPHFKWYALALTRILIAAGYKMNQQGHERLIHLLLTEAVCNEKDQNNEEEFMRTWGAEMFPRQALVDGIEKLDINLNDLEPRYRERASDFLVFMTTHLKDVGTLQNLCRKKIREHLMELQPNKNLYLLVTQIPLSVNMIRYLLFELKPPKPSYYDYTTIYFEESFV